MKKRRYLLAVICLFIAVVCSGGFIQSSAVTVQAAAKTTGFVKKGNYWYFYDKKGKLVKGWYQPSSGRKYYFGKTGAAKSGILTINGKKYCFNAKGRMLTTWQTVNGKTYFFDEKNGYMYTGWITTPAGNKYYFWKDGVIRSGFHKVGKTYYCFSNKGKMLSEEWQIYLLSES